jgi:hypothetical protein
MSQRLLTDGNNQLYNPIFCDLFPTNNGFNTCQNCNFDNLTLWEEIHKNNEQECLTDCDKDERCTSYSFDNSKNDKNCSKYRSFPSSINNNVQNINSGYSLKYGFDYRNLNSSRQDNVKTKCANQYLNNIFTPDKNINLNKCLEIKDVNDDLYKEIKNTEFRIDPKCLYNQYKENGINPPIISVDNYYDSNLPPIKNDKKINDKKINDKKIYKSEGCYKDAIDRVLPNIQSTRVRTPYECAKMAIDKKVSVFGVQNGNNREQLNGECWLGNGLSNDLEQAKKYGKADDCGPLGGTWINHVYTIDEDNIKNINSVDNINNVDNVEEPNNDNVNNSTFDFYKNSQHDLEIETYEKAYNTYKTKKNNNLNNQNMNNTYSSDNNNDENENNILKNKYDEYLSNEKKNINSLSNSIINQVSTVESFENNNLNLIYFNNCKMILFIIIIIIIFMILFYTFKK